MIQNWMGKKFFANPLVEDGNGSRSEEMRWKV